MKTLLKVLPLILMASLFSGCMAPQVPSKTIRFGNVEASLPMDATAKGLEIKVEATTATTTNTFFMKAANWSTKNNPDSIEASTEQIKAHYDGTAKLIKEGVEAGIKAGAKSAVPIP